MQIRTNRPLAEISRRALPQKAVKQNTDTNFDLGPSDRADLQLLQAPTPKAAPESPNPESSASKKIEELVGQVLSDPEAEKQLIGLLQVLNATGQLKPTLTELAAAGMESGAIPPMPQAKVDAMVEQASGMIDAQFRERGMTPDTVGTKYVSWEEMSAQHLNAVRNTQAPPRMAGGLSLLSNPTFLSELETLQGSKFSSGNQVKTLMDGPASFAERDRMIEGAKDSIDLMTWAIYDDETGWDAVKKLANKAAEGVKVRVIVDGQVSERHHHNAPTKFLEENGVEVVRWRDEERIYDGQHRKMMIVDGKEAIAGGLNIGNVYSHKAGDIKWRDTDIHFTGPAVTDGSRLFAEIWNEEAQEFGFQLAEIPSPAAPQSGGSKSAVVNHNPGPDGDAHIMLATMKAIEGATESIDIENAYFINTPGLKDTLLKALDEGVRVRLLTNSAESIDEPIITAPILGSLPELIEAGAEVYLKKGDTLHSKFMTVDGLFSSVGSHNHHPRSQRFEGEMVVNSLDPQLAESFTQAFEADIAAADRMAKPEDVQVPESIFGLLATRYFFDAL